LSLQFHREKDESWLVQAGRAKLELGSAGDALPEEGVVRAGACFHFSPGTVHRLTAIEDTTIIEVSTTQLDDIVRLEDRYGREGDLRAAVDTWLAGTELSALDWEQRKHERLLAA